jgi:hypothetical protein
MWQETESVNDRQQEQERLTANIEDFLRELIEGLEPKPPSTNRGRPRILPAMCLWAGLLVCVLRGMGSQLAIWRTLASKSLWSYPQFAVSDQAVYKRLEAGGTDELQRLFQEVSSVLRVRLAPYARTRLTSFTKTVVALDTTTLDPVARTLPSLRDIPPGDKQLLPGKLAGVFDIGYQQWLSIHHIVDPNENDKVSARKMLADVAAGALILADMGYFGFEWFDDLTDSGYFWLSRLRQKTSYEVQHVYYEDGDTFDGIVFLGVYRADRAKHAVRLVTYRHESTLHRYITNVLDPRVFPLADIARVYACRWDFEMAIKLLKRELKLHLLWSAKPTVILQQVWAALIIAQVLHGLQLEIAGRAGVDPFDVSLPLIVEYFPKWSYDGTDVLKVFVEHGRQVGFIRPSRRIRPQTPFIDPHALDPLPPNLSLYRTPRYANRRCNRRGELH